MLGLNTPFKTKRDGILPEFFSDFGKDYFRKDRVKSSFDDIYTPVVTGLSTFVDSTGVLKWNPHNLFDYSDYNASVATTGAPSVSSADGPEGANTAYFVDDNSAANFGGIVSIAPAVAGAEYTFSALVNKTVGALTDYPGMQIVNTGANYGVVIDTTNGTLTELSVSYDASAGFSSIVSYDDDFWLVSLTLYSSSTNSLRFDAFPALANALDGAIDASATGTATYAMLRAYRSDLGGMADNPDRGDDYVPTSGAAVYLPRRNAHVYNGSAWVPAGLRLESEARTNVEPDSEDILANWNAIDGATLSAGTDGFVIAGLGVANERVYGTSFTVANGETFTGSMEIDASQSDDGAVDLYVGMPGQFRSLVNLIISGNTVTLGTLTENAGNVENGPSPTAFIEQTGPTTYRVAVNSTNVSGGNLSFVVGLWSDTPAIDVAFRRPQLEEGASPSSYIPTNGATATRAAESMSIASANLPWWRDNPVYQSEELLTNTAFAGATGTTPPTGFTSDGTTQFSLSGDELTITRSGGTGIIDQTVSGLTIGQTYLVEVVAVSSPTGVARLEFPAASGNVDTDTSPNETLSVTFVATGTSHTFRIQAANDVNAVITVKTPTVRAIEEPAVSIALKGRMTYADKGVAEQFRFIRWGSAGTNAIQNVMNTDSINTGLIVFRQWESSVSDLVATAATAYSPGINVPFNIASRHGSTFINGASDGIALTADTTPTALPDLSAANLNFALNFMGYVESLRIWAADIRDTGITRASS